jgi:hypothetical protein
MEITSIIQGIGTSFFLASGGGQHNILQDIGLSIIVATALAHIARVLKHPLVQREIGSSYLFGICSLVGNIIINNRIFYRKNKLYHWRNTRTRMSVVG